VGRSKSGDKEYELMEKKDEVLELVPWHEKTMRCSARAATPEQETARKEPECDFLAFAKSTRKDKAR
jgi:hypothetical protein